MARVSSEISRNSRLWQRSLQCREDQLQNSLLKPTGSSKNCRNLKRRVKFTILCTSRRALVRNLHNTEEKFERRNLPHLYNMVGLNLNMFLRRPP
jgi:hypothetical protein